MGSEKTACIICTNYFTAYEISEDKFKNILNMRTGCKPALMHTLGYTDAGDRIRNELFRHLHSKKKSRDKFLDWVRRTSLMIHLWRCVSTCLVLQEYFHVDIRDSRASFRRTKKSSSRFAGRKWQRTRGSPESVQLNSESVRNNLYLF